MTSGFVEKDGGGGGDWAFEAACRVVVEAAIETQTERRGRAEVAVERWWRVGGGGGEEIWRKVGVAVPRNGWLCWLNFSQVPRDCVIGPDLGHQ